MRSADGAGAEENLFPPGPDPLLPSSWSPDGRTLALTRLGPVTQIQLLTLGEKPRPFETDASTPAFSPDGRWIAYQSPASGVSNVHVRVVDGEGKWQISTESGGYPRWSSDGREPLYIAVRNQRRPLMTVPTVGGEAYALRELESIYREAGFDEFVGHLVPTGPHTVVVGRAA